jgi:hypothetical protein
LKKGAEVIDDMIHHEILPKLPGDITITPKVNPDWTNPNVEFEGFEIKYEVPLEDLFKACGVK